MKNVTSRLTIRDRRAFVSGAFFLTVAVFFYAVALGYAPGTTARMGPGYFPRLLSIVLAAIGLFVMAGALRSAAEMQRLRAWDLKGLLWVTGSVMLFAFLLLSTRPRDLAVRADHGFEQGQSRVHLEGRVWRMPRC